MGFDLSLRLLWWDLNRRLVLEGEGAIGDGDGAAVAGTKVRI